MAADGNYLYPFAIALSSARRFADKPLSLKLALPLDWRHLLTPQQVEVMLELANSLGIQAQAIECDIDAADLPKTMHISSMAFVKPALFDRLPNEGTLVWLDTDTVTIKPWCQIADLVFDQAIAATRELNTEFENRWGDGHSRDWYFNSGVMAINLEKWHLNYAQTWQPLLKDYEENNFIWLDQDIFNALIRSNSDPLPSTFNHLVLKNEDVKEAVVLHFAGWWKPWMRTKRQVKLLHEPIRTAFELYAEAEEYFFDGVKENLGSQGLRTWEKIKTSTRGGLGLKAHKHYFKGVLRDSL